MEDTSQRLLDEGLEILDEDECLRLMGTVPVGRVAVTLGALPAVLPVNFVLCGRRIVFRTGQGTKLDAAVRHAVVAFEVDDFDASDRSAWSVLAVGRGENITDVESIGADNLVQPWAGGERDHYVAIDAEFLSGRRLERPSAVEEDDGG
jgi:nitroimidazol reductase NimA-like FMN-containing flavoprotein (pyridoxamine 5'-phosphate oxidase superfamily)